MTRHIRILLPAVLALSAAGGLALAQTAPVPAPQAAEPAQRQRPSADAMQRMEDGKFAMIKGALKLTDTQQKLWQPVEDLVRARHADRMKKMQDWDAKRADGKQVGGQRDDAASVADRLDRQSKRASAEAEQLKAYSAVFRPFYDSLSEQQKVVAGPLMAGLSGEHRMKGHRFAGRDDHGEHGGHRNSMPQ